MERHKIVGEPFVWLTGMGLALGILMVVSLLILIVVNGLEVFWPDRIMQIKLKKGSVARINDSDYIGGRFVQKQQKASQSDPQDVEWQLFIANKDIYGLGFKYVDRRDIEEISYPRGVMVLERIEYGDAIVYPLSLTGANGKQIAANDPLFLKAFHALTLETAKRWDDIRDLEQKEIGKINSRLEKLNVRKRSVTTDGSIDLEITQLQKVYDVLAKRAGELRSLQEKGSFDYKLMSGETKTLPLSQVVHSYFPNRMNIFQRLIHFFNRLWNFLSQQPREANTEGGIFPAIFGTFVMTLLLSIAVTPFGVLAAIYLREYARQGLFVRSVRIAVNNLAGVPSIVFGVFGLGFFVYTVGGTIDQLFFSDYLPAPTFGTGGILWASLTLALMTVPVVIVATEESLAAVPRGVREGSLACGASKWQTIQRIVLPAASTGILTGLILAMARGAGEVAPLMLVGVVKLAPSLPLDGVYPFLHLDQKFMHLGFHICDLGFQSPDSEAAKPMVFATTFLLILLVVILNLGAILIRERLRRKYATAAF